MCFLSRQHQKLTRPFSYDVYFLSSFFSAVCACMSSFPFVIFVSVGVLWRFHFIFWSVILFYFLLRPLACSCGVLISCVTTHYHCHTGQLRLRSRRYCESAFVHVSSPPSSVCVCAPTLQRCLREPSLCLCREPARHMKVLLKNRRWKKISFCCFSVTDGRRVTCVVCSLLTSSIPIRLQ